MLGLLGFASFMFGLVTSIAGELPALDPANRSNQVNGYVYAGDGHTILAVLRGDESRVVVESKDIAPVMKSAIVAIEDRRFYDHRGVDFKGIVRAVWADLRHKRVVEGGSTITQQFVKNAYVKNQRTIARKVREAALAWQLSQRWSKDRVLTAYLNTIYFGNQAYGIQQAARVYFDKRATDLTLPEAALLAGIPRDPTAYDPATHPRGAKARRNTVLHAMLQQRLIDASEYRAAAAAPLPKAQDIRLPGTQGQFAPYFANYVKEQLLHADYLGKTPSERARRIYGGGLRVRTTIDLELQRMARDAVAKWVPPSTDGTQNHPTAALVTIDAKTGAVLAMVGGENYHRSQFNLATQRNRQTGSAFKPFVLATALKEGISPQTTLVSEPVTINLGDKLWRVNNYEGEYMGPISIATATAHSDNSVFAQLTALVQPKRIVSTAHQLGITGKLSGFYSIGLGGEAASPLEMARAYAAFANGGSRIDGAMLGNVPRVIDSIRMKGKTLVNAPVKEPVLSSNDAAIVTQLLQGVVSSGTGRRAALSGWAAAGKTGTTENYGDAWFVGYTPQLVTAVWVGYPTKLVPMLTEFHGSPVAGGTYPALIWKTFMEQALRHVGATPESFAAPSYPYSTSQRVTIRDGRLELDNGNCRSTSTIVFFSGQAPARTAPCKKNEVDVPRVVGETLANAKARLEAQPLTPAFVYKPAAPRQRLGIVLGQFPAGGTLSSYDKVTLVLAKPLHGTVPKLVGLKVQRARAKLRKRKLQAVVRGEGTRVVAQRPKAGVAAAPGMKVTLVVGRG